MHRLLFAIVQRPPVVWRLPSSALGVIDTRAFGELVVVSSLLDRIPEPNARTLALYHEVVAATMEAEGVLPFHFGTALHAEELDGWLAANAERIRAALDQLRGCVEMTVKLLRLNCGHGRERSCPACAGGAPGADTLRVLADHLVERAGVARWRFRLAGHGSNLAGAVAFLVPHGEVDALLARIAPVASRAPGVAVVPTGPWPAYSFAPPLDRPPLTRVESRDTHAGHIAG
jgi:gas vesicle protein GvpL/GvpF